jgi:ATP-binding cassette subfamily B protein
MPNKKATRTLEGLQEPLLAKENGNETSDTTTTDDRTRQDEDEERGILLGSANSVTDEEASETIVTPLFYQAYRRPTVYVALLDVLVSTFLTYLCWKRGEDENSSYKRVNPNIVLGLSIFKCILLSTQATRFSSKRATKVAGYLCLLTFLAILVQFSLFLGDDVQSSYFDIVADQALLATLLAWSALITIVECFYALLVGFYSSVDTSVSVAPTANEAVEGLVTDTEEAKSIELWELLKILRPYFWPDGKFNRLCVIMTWVFLIGSKGSNILSPLFIAKATDDLTLGHSTTATTWHILIYVGFKFLNKVFGEAQSLSYIRVRTIAQAQLQQEIFSHLMSLSIDWHQRKSIGAVTTAMQRGIQASNSVVQYIFLYLFPTLVEMTVVTFVFFGAFGSPLLASSAVCGCILYIALTCELTNWRMQYRKKLNKAGNDAWNKTTDALLNIETVKLFTAEDREVTRLRESVDIVQDQSYKIQGSLSALNISQQVLLNLTLIATLLVAASEYRRDNFTIGQFVAANVYILQLFAPLNFLGSIYGMAMNSYVDLQNLCNILAEKLDVEDKEDAIALRSSVRSEETGANLAPLEVEFKDVVFSYPSRKDIQVLKNISFTIPSGTTTAVVGETGSGKSTITKLLLRFYEADQGKVSIDGKDVMDITQKSLRGNIGVVSQDTILFNDTIGYNIQYGASDRDQVEDDPATTDAAQRAQLDDFLKSIPKGMKTIVGERGMQLSGGQKQRVAIARVLMKDAPMVVLDEATSSLDSKTEEQIQGALDNLRGQGRTMLIIAHRLSTIQEADQIIVMANGEILERGNHETLMKKGIWHERSYASLWDRQKQLE